MKFRKRPIVIEAEQFFPDKVWPVGIEQYIEKKTENVIGLSCLWYGWRILTLEGYLEVRPGDWIITGIQGEKYPCKPDIFQQTYEIVEDCT